MSPVTAVISLHLPISLKLKIKYRYTTARKLKILLQDLSIENQIVKQFFIDIFYQESETSNNFVNVSSVAFKAE